MSEEEITETAIGDPVALRAKVKTLHEALITSDQQLKEARAEIERLRAELSSKE